MEELIEAALGGTRNISVIAPRPLQIKDLVKLGHFNLRVGKSRRELLHGSFLPVGEESAPGAGMPMPF